MRIDGKVGCIDKTGKVIVPIIYDDIQVPLDGNLIATVDWKKRSGGQDWKRNNSNQV